MVVISPVQPSARFGAASNSEEKRVTCGAFQTLKGIARLEEVNSLATRSLLLNKLAPTMLDRSVKPLLVRRWCWYLSTKSVEVQFCFPVPVPFTLLTETFSAESRRLLLMNPIRRTRKRKSVSPMSSNKEIGRPSQWPEQYLRILIVLRLCGLTLKEILQLVNVLSGGAFEPK
jgi:hypothetical protein